MRIFWLHLGVRYYFFCIQSTEKCDFLSLLFFFYLLGWCVRAGHNEFALRCFAIYCISLFDIPAAVTTTTLVQSTVFFFELTRVCALTGWQQQGRWNNANVPNGFMLIQLNVHGRTPNQNAMYFVPRVCALRMLLFTSFHLDAFFSSLWLFYSQLTLSISTEFNDWNDKNVT